MTNQDYRAVLRNNQAEIEQKILSFTSNDSRIKFNKFEYELSMNTILDTSIDDWINKATCPEVTDNDFNAVAYFVAGIKRYYNSYLRLNVHKRVIRQKSSVSLHTLGTEGSCLTEANILENEMYERDITGKENEMLYINEATKVTQSALHDFRRNATTTDIWLVDSLTQILGVHGGLKSATCEFFNTSSPTQAQMDKLKYMANAVKFRFACLLASKKYSLFADHIVLKGLNEFPKLIKRFFGVDKLDKIPSDVDLLKIAYSSEVKELAKLPSVSKNTGKWKELSKVDFTGKRHNHFVVYVSPDGKKVYDNVTKTSVKREDFVEGKIA